MRRLLRLLTPVVAGVALTGLAMMPAWASSSSAGPLAGKRSVVVTVRDDRTGDKLVYPFTLSDTDRLYVTRIEAEVVHTVDGSSDEVVYPAGYKLGNVTVSRVQR